MPITKPRTVPLFVSSEKVYKNLVRSHAERRYNSIHPQCFEMQKAVEVAAPSISR